MPPEGRDPAWLWDVRHSLEKVLELVGNASVEDLQSDQTARLAVERLLEVAGEAARRLSASFRTAHPEVDWVDLIARRNVIAHQYDNVLYERIWDFVRLDVPGILDTLDALMPPDPEDTSGDGG